MKFLSVAGKLCVVLGFLLCTSFFLLLFGVPLFLLGVAGVWVAPGSTAVKLAWTLAPLVLYYPVVSLLVALV